MNYHYKVSARFRTEIELHLVRNLMRTPAPGTPLLLGVHGPPGVGKSFQIDAVLKEVGVAVTPISSADLESDHANDPAKLLRKAYLATADRIDNDGVIAAALVINDIDSALGDWGELVQYTVNRQLVLGELMRLCDRPSSVIGRPNSRVPIFLTANDLSKLYGPVMRPGRTKLFYWLPNQDELVEMLRGIVPHFDLKEAVSVVQEFPTATVAFFADALNEARDELVRERLTTQGVRATILAGKRGEMSLNSAVSTEQLIIAGKRLLANEAAVRNYTNNSTGVR